jgi:hypothetical protein
MRTTDLACYRLLTNSLGQPVSGWLATAPDFAKSLNKTAQNGRQRDSLMLPLPSPVIHPKPSNFRNFADSRAVRTLPMGDLLAAAWHGRQEATFIVVWIVA